MRKIKFISILLVLSMLLTMSAFAFSTGFTDVSEKASYPKCLLCVENVGYAGTISHPARQNLRVMPVTVNGQPWGFQYSPYVYYNEHAIVMNTEHMTTATVRRINRRFLKSFCRQSVGGIIMRQAQVQAGLKILRMNDWQHV